RCARTAPDPKPGPVTSRPAVRITMRDVAACAPATHPCPADSGELMPSSNHVEAPASEPAVQVTDVRKSFGEVHALQGISFTAKKASVLGVLGPNGAGKTTTVKILATLLRPDSGTAIVAGHDVQKDPAGVRRSIMMTGQYAALDENLSGRENLELFGRLMGLSKSAARTRADTLLEEFDLVSAGRRAVRNYSGGMRRRVDIA